MVIDVAGTGASGASTRSRRERGYAARTVSDLAAAAAVMAAAGLASAGRSRSRPAVAATSLAVASGGVLLGLSVARSLRASDASPRGPRDGPVVLAVGAHPDDLELACGGTLAKLVDAGYAVHAVVMSKGQVGGNAQLRPSEARAGGKLLGLASVQVLDFPDTELGLHNVGMVKAIETRIEELQPALILTHSENDHHQDHHAVHFATMRAARRHPSIICFESPSTTRGFNPSLYVDIAEHLDVKIRAVELHGDQSEKPYMGAHRIRGVAAFRGGQAKKTFAEGFEVVRLLDTLPGGKL